MPKKINEHELITRLFHTQIKNSKKRDHCMPSYTQSELSDWLYRKSNFKDLFASWVESNYCQAKKPSIDRLDITKGYSFENIRVVTWGENNKKGNWERRLAIKPDQHKSVIQIDKNMKIVNEYVSTADASRRTNICQSSISAVCIGKRNTAGGYIWNFKKERVA
jgi:hypothetical protein